MTSEIEAPNRAEVVNEVSKWTVGLGIVGVALFPLSIPILVLTAAALVPLALPLLAVGLLAVPILLAGRLVSGLRKGTGRRRSAGPIAPPTSATSTRSSSVSIPMSTGSRS